MFDNKKRIDRLVICLKVWIYIFQIKAGGFDSFLPTTRYKIKKKNENAFRFITQKLLNLSPRRPHHRDHTADIITDAG